jgi:hypothetical protein
MPAPRGAAVLPGQVSLRGQVSSLLTIIGTFLFAAFVLIASPSGLPAQESRSLLKEPAKEAPKPAKEAPKPAKKVDVAKKPDADQPDSELADSESSAEKRPSSDSASNSSTRGLPANAKTFAEVRQIARAGVKRIDGEIRDYSCLMVKRERVEGVLGDYQYMVAKVRHRTDTTAFSLYLRFLKPQDVQEREVLFVTGANDGKIVAKKGGFRFSYLTTEVNPDSEIAMQGNRYPITEFGVQNLAHRLLEIAENKDIANEFDVELRRQSKVDDRECLLIIVTKRERTTDDHFYLARVFIDKKLMVPIHFEAYDWPTQGKKPRLLEQYTYRNLKLNIGLTAADFDRNNPSYGFRKKR